MGALRIVHLKLVTILSFLRGLTHVPKGFRIVQEFLVFLLKSYNIVKAHTFLELVYYPLLMLYLNPMFS